MTADLLRQRLFKRLTEARAAKVETLRRCKPRTPMIMQEGQVVPASTAEDIAFAAVEINATVDTYEACLTILAEEFKALTTPEQPAEDETETKARKPIYG